MKYQLIIKLKSDLCTASGESLGSFIDSDICYDDNGFPYIPSKRIKGLIKEAALEYCAWDEKYTPYINSIFGIEGSPNSAKLIIDNAYIKDYDKIQEEIKQIPSEYKRYTAVQRIINNYTYIRFQTAIDEQTGTSKDNSLRTTRVVKEQTEFASIIAIDNPKEEELDLLKRTIKMVTHMGMNRTRGYGEVVLELQQINDEETKKTNITPLEDNKLAKIEILFKTESNIIVAKQNTEITNKYIPGSNILGNIANRYIKDKKITNFENIDSEFIKLFLDGEVKYSNAYISTKDKKIFYPAPFSYAKVKNTDNQFYNKLLFNIDLKQDIQLSSIVDKYITLDYDKDYIKDVIISESYHHQRPKDKSIGHAIPKEDGGTLYQYLSIDKNQYFLATIEGPTNDLNKIIKYLTIGDIFRVGKSRNTEYGKLKIVDLTYQEQEKIPKEYQDFAVLFTSDTIIINKETAQSTIDKEVLIKRLKEHLKIDTDPINAFINYEKSSGYNAIWNLPKEQLESFKAGTIFRFKTAKPITLYNEYTIGNRTNEGCGHIKIIDLKDKTEKLNLEEKQESQKTIELQNLSKETLTILQQSIKNTILDDLCEKAIQEFSKNHGLNNSTIGRLQLMLKQSSTLDEFITNAKSIKQKEKLAKVEEILEYAKNTIFKLKSIKDLSTINKILNKNIQNQEINQEIYIDKKEYDKYRLEYLKQAFIQIKLKGEEK